MSCRRHDQIPQVELKRGGVKKLEVIVELKVNIERWVLEKIESAMFKDDMLLLTENQKKTSSLPSLLNFNESRKVNSDLSSFFDKFEEKRE